MDGLSFFKHFLGGDFATGDVQKKVVVKIFHGGLHVLKHEAVKVTHAFANCGVFCIGGGEVGLLEKGCGVEEHYQAVCGPFGHVVRVQGTSVDKKMPQEAGYVESERFLQELSSVHLDVGCLLADVFLQLLCRDVRHVLKVPWKKTIHRTLRI